MNANLTSFAKVWLIVVISVLTLFGLLKTASFMFSAPPAPTLTHEEWVYDHCLQNTSSDKTEICNKLLKDTK